MKKLYFLICALLITAISFGQTTLFIVDGPANGTTTIGSPEDGGDIDIYFGTTK